MGSRGKPTALICLLLFSSPLLARTRAQSYPGLERRDPAARRAAIAKIGRRLDLEAAPRLLALLAREQDGAISLLAVKTMRRLMPCGLLPSLRRLEAERRPGELKRRLGELVAALERALPVARSDRVPPSRPPSPEDLQALRRLIGPRRLQVEARDQEGAPLAGALVRVWSHSLGLWLPLPERGGEQPGYGRLDRAGRIAMVVPQGRLVVAVWTRNALLWKRVEPGRDRPLVLQVEERLRLVERGWRGDRVRLEGWPAGPWPAARFPAWSAAEGTPFFVGVRCKAPLDLLLTYRTTGSAAATGGAPAASHLFLRNIHPQGILFPRSASVLVKGDREGRISALSLALSPRLRPDLVRTLVLPPQGGRIRMGLGTWRAAMAWSPAAGGRITSHPRSLVVLPRENPELAVHPLRGSVFARREVRLGTGRDVLSLAVLFRTPDGSVLESYDPPAGRRVGGIVVTGPDGRARGGGALDRRFRCRLDRLAPAGWREREPRFAVRTPFAAIQVSGLQERDYAGEHFSLKGPMHLEARTDAILTMGEIALRAALRVTGGRFPWRRVPVIARNHLPPGVGASAAGSCDHSGWLAFNLHSLLGVAMPADVLAIPWIHELGHKLGYGHGAGMRVQTVATAYAMLGAEGVECNRAFSGTAAWQVACGTLPSGRVSPLVPVAILRRLVGGRPLTRFLRQRDRWRWYLEGEGVPEEAAALGALAFFSGRPVDGWFRALGWTGPALQAARARNLLADLKQLPPAGLASALADFRGHLARGGNPAELIERVAAIRIHRERAEAALEAATRCLAANRRESLAELVRLAQDAAVGSTHEVWRRTRCRALAIWAEATR